MSPDYSYLKRDISVTVAGLEDSGKTYFINRLLGYSPSQVFSTMGVNHELYNADGIILGITDLGGLPSFRKTLWKSFISRSDALIYVTDITKREQLTESKKWLSRSLNWLKEENPVLVLFNMRDEKFSSSEVKSIIKRFSNGIRKRNINYLSTSFSSGKNFDQTVNWLASSIIQQLIVDKITVEMFISYIKTSNGVYEMRLTTPQSHLNSDVLSPVIQCKFSSSQFPIIEILKYRDRQFIMAADDSVSCWLVTTRMEQIRSTNLLTKLLLEFVKDLQGINKTERSLTETEISRYLLNNIIDKQVFWSVKSTPLFEISLIRDFQDE
ncbi:MAG: 50S ribosome-binding GTPase [Candidatus Heimdallarchaeum endolithica]|uniref:50S ribosome-binding GTPase n=1 Tax=Candidatus Heimdallarchaeum endolithica TaxID=2876572 RepID=A0A9Y1BQC7_9ARCH|nr:MAG: 50S ribosome-binding GTPase [Candidatus Heimdallarchaeum endolithica]